MRKLIQRTVRGNLDETFFVSGRAHQKFDLEFVIKHRRPQTSSRIAIGVVARGNAKIKLNATTIIEKTAPDTKAWLEIRAVVCDQATVAAAPNLEICHNAVKAGHALSTKRISEEELFYLTSRGLPRAAAEKLIIEAWLKPFQKGTIIS